MLYTIESIVEENRAAGRHFFSPAVMQALAYRTIRNVYQGPGGVYFVTVSKTVEHDSWKPRRRYVVRRFHPDSAEVTSPSGEVYEGATGRAEAIERAAMLAAGAPTRRQEAQRALAERVVRGEA